MSPEWISVATGPASGLVMLIVAVIVLVKGQLVVPGYVHRSDRQQIEALNAEALKQDELLHAQSDQLTEQRIANAKLEAQVSHLSEQVQRLTAEIEGLRKQVGQL